MADTRALLLSAASTLLADEGPEALTVRRIAATAGVSTMGVYSRFGGKDGVVDALFREGFDGLLAAMLEAPTTDDPLADLRSCLPRLRRRQRHALPDHVRGRGPWVRAVRGQQGGGRGDLRGVGRPSPALRRRRDARRRVCRTEELGRGQQADVVTATEVSHHRIDEPGRRDRTPRAVLRRDDHVETTSSTEDLAGVGQALQRTMHPIPRETRATRGFGHIEG